MTASLPIQLSVGMWLSYRKKVRVDGKDVTSAVGDVESLFADIAEAAFGVGGFVFSN